MPFSEGLLVGPLPGSGLAEAEQTPCGHGGVRAERRRSSHSAVSGGHWVGLLSPVPWKPNDLRIHQPAQNGVEGAIPKQLMGTRGRMQ